MSISSMNAGISGLTANSNKLARRPGLCDQHFQRVVCFWDAGAGPTGRLLGFARKQSTTGVAQTLTQLIQARLLVERQDTQAVDETLQETTNLKR